MLDQFLMHAQLICWRGMALQHTRRPSCSVVGHHACPMHVHANASASLKTALPLTPPGSVASSAMWTQPSHSSAVYARTALAYAPQVRPT